MREDRRRRYDDGFRREALELIKSGAGKDTLARRLAIPVYTARNWIMLYRSNGEEAVMGGGGSRRYDWETKVAASRDHVENGLTKTVLGVMRRMGLRCAIRSRNPWRRYSSYRGETGDRVHNLPERDFDAARPFSRLGTDVTEFKVAGSKAYLAPVYDMASKEIVAWDVSRSPDLGQQKRLPAMLAERLPAGAEPILHSDMGWQYQHQWWRKELERPGIRRSMSRKGNCLDNAAAEQVFGHLKDEFYRGREFDSFERFKAELDAYIIHWNTRRRQIRLEGRTPEEFRSMPPRSDPVSQLTTSNKRGAVHYLRRGLHIHIRCQRFQAFFAAWAVAIHLSSSAVALPESTVCSAMA